MSVLDSVRAVWSYTHLSASEVQRGVALASASGTAPADLPQWKSFALTELLYRDHDAVSKAFALSSFLPLLLVIFLAGLASAPCRERRLPALTLLLFIVGSVCVNVTCKALLQSPRPSHPAAGRNYTTTHGMPSDHAQFMAGFVVYLARRWSRGVSSEERLGRAPAGKRGTRASTKGSKLSVAMPGLLAAFCAAAAFLVGAGRVFNGYHTVGQVVVGWTLGAVLGYVCTTAAVQRVLKWTAETVMLPVMLVCTHWTHGVC